MPPQRKLRSISNTRTPAKRAPGRPKKLLAEAVRDGERAILATLRSKLAKQIDDCTRPSALAALIRQFREIDGQIRAMDARAAEAAKQDLDDVEDDDDDQSFDASQI